MSSISNLITYNKCRTSIICRIYSVHNILKNVNSIGGRVDITLNTVQPPPNSISAIITGIHSSIKQVRDESMPKASSICQDYKPVINMELKLQECDKEVLEHKAFD